MEHTEHTWTTTSTHPTSEGVVSYEQCSCGTRRIVTGRPVGRTRALALVRV